MRLRGELQRVVQLMQQEVLPRERRLHEMFEKLNLAARFRGVFAGLQGLLLLYVAFPFH